MAARLGHGAGMRLVRLLALILAVGAPAAAQDLRGIGVFDLPRHAAMRAEAARRFAGGDGAGAAELLRAEVARLPQAPGPRADLAQVLAATGADAAALEALAAAVDLGVAPTAALITPAFQALARRRSADPALAELARRPPGAPPADRPKLLVAPVRDRVAAIHATNTAWNAELGVLEPKFDFAGGPGDVPIRRPDPGPVSRLLELWAAQGKAAGNHGDLYDNRDAGHSVLDPGLMPQIARTLYGPEAVAAGVHYGLNTQFRFDAAVIGNSSTAVAAGPYWRSQPRLAMTQGGAGQLARLYAWNHLYVFPEHRDHDPGLGDLFPANTPYVVISQGSSGSDRPFLEALAAILAALPPETKARARDQGLLGATLQLVLRQGMAAVRQQSDYLTGAAHPSVFEPEAIELERMVRLAQALRPETLPPLVRLAVVEESLPRPGVEIFGEGLDERLFTTPQAIARLALGTAATRRMVVSAADTVDPNGRDLTFRWVVLRGDAARIGIRPLDRAARSVELTIPWHVRGPVPGRADLTTDRVDIGVFADNGAGLSAPAFVTWMFPGGETREVAADGRPLAIDYDTPRADPASLDPLLFALRDWRDVYDYGPDGALTGWTRARGGALSHFTADGARVVARDATGAVTATEPVTYPITVRPDGRRVVAEVGPDDPPATDAPPATAPPATAPPAAGSAPAAAAGAP